MGDIERTEDANQSSTVQITVTVQNRYRLDWDAATGHRIEELARIPQALALHRRVPGGNERIHDDDVVQLRDGDHFFARPGSTAS